MNAKTLSRGEKKIENCFKNLCVPATPRLCVHSLLIRLLDADRALHFVKDNQKWNSPVL